MKHLSQRRRLRHSSPATPSLPGLFTIAIHLESPCTQNNGIITPFLRVTETPGRLFLLEASLTEAFYRRINQPRCRLRSWLQGASCERGRLRAGNIRPPPLPCFTLKDVSHSCICCLFLQDLDPPTRISVFLLVSFQDTTKKHWLRKPTRPWCAFSAKEQGCTKKWPNLWTARPPYCSPFSRQQTHGELRGIDAVDLQAWRGRGVPGHTKNPTQANTRTQEDAPRVSGFLGEQRIELQFVTPLKPCTL